MSASTTTKPTVPGGKPAYVLKSDCQRCGRVDFPVLLVTSSVVDKKHAKALDSAGYKFQPGFDAAFAAMPRLATAPVIRLLPRGFVFVFYDKRGVWDVWQSYDDGTYKKLLEHVTPDEYAGKAAALKPETAGSVCQRGAANLPAGLITLLGAANQPAIWVGYSPHLWTPQVLADFHQDVNKRLESMTLIWAQTWMDGGSIPGKGCVPLNEEGLKHNVVDFNDDVPPGGAKFNPLVRVFANAVVPLPQARFGQAKAMVERVREIEKTAGPKAENKAVIAYVRNPIGLAEEFAALVGEVQAAYTEFTALGPKTSGKYDPDWAWKHQSSVNVRYVQQWAVERARKQVEAKAEQYLNGPQNAPITREVFDENRKKGLYPEGTVWKAISQKVDGEVKPHPQKLGRVIYSKEHIEKTAKAMGQDEVKGRSERYLGKVDMKALAAFEQLHRSWNKHWEDRFVSAETDRALWLESQPFTSCMSLLFDSSKALCGGDRTPREVRIQVQEAFDRLAATDRAYGTAAMTPVMVRHMAKMFGKDETDKTHWVAQAMLTEFDLVQKVIGEPPDHGFRADLYDAALLTQSDWGEFSNAWNQLKEAASVMQSNLLSAAAQATSTLTVAALDAEKAKKYALSATLEEASKKRVIWVRAAALHEFLSSNEKQYYVNVRWKVGAFLDSTIDALKAPMFELKFNHGAPQSQQSRRSAAATSRAQLRKLQALYGMDKEILVPVLLSEEAVKQAAARRSKTMLPVVSANLLGLPQALVEVPEEFAQRVLREQATFREGWFKRFAEGVQANKVPALGGAGVMFMQSFALSQALDDLNKKGGVEQVDAAAAAVSGALGVAGAMLEIGYLLSVPTPSAAAVPQAAELAAKIPRHMVLRFATGILGGAGAWLDAVSAFSKAVVRRKRGDIDAATTHVASGLFHFTGGAGIVYGSYVSWRAAQLTRIAVQGAVRVALLPAMGVTAVAGLGLTITGVGLLLWVGGVAIGVIAAMLEDDECDSFMRRTYFGIGGDQLMKKFSSVEDETLELGALALGMKVELEWNDELFGADEVTAKISSMDWDPNNRGLAVRVEGFKSTEDKEPTAVLADGDILLPGTPNTQGVYEVVLKYAVPEKDVHAVRCSFALFDTALAVRRAPEQRWQGMAGVRPLARGYAWIED